MVRPDAPDTAAERARRVAVLQFVESTFDPIPFGVEAARCYGLMCAAVQASGRTPRRRIAELMIAATAASNGLPLYTTNPSDYEGLDGIVHVVALPRPRTDDSE
ncbi:hypothetical protein J4N02_01110 [Propioniciclava sp. MC1595]|uniref:hypothetical protein n=1 Tax=Propioniciclava sp. MC1595 TaxID=2760308 RepID=UPI0016624B09|nr:hypothetical protein [Propioniciclava sp. MC1595]MBB1495030.1 hypothetical protein [Propioniciclava sp. MC1595]QTE26267.1 hypothetical protein J4N02_01110 [Propioniciclava sp. MC1595]